MTRVHRNQTASTDVWSEILFWIVAIGLVSLLYFSGGRSYFLLGLLPFIFYAYYLLCQSMVLNRLGTTSVSPIRNWIWIAGAVFIFLTYHHVLIVVSLFPIFFVSKL